MTDHPCCPHTQAAHNQDGCQLMVCPCTVHACNADDFDRTICPEPCGDMHVYCTVCGIRQDHCAHDREPADE